MTSYEIQKYGGPEGLKLVDRPLPDPGNHEVLVRIKAASLNYRDLVVLRGRYDRNPVTGRIPLSDGAGVVVAVGPAVTKFKTGDRVAACFFQGWSAGRFKSEMHRTALGGSIDGVLVEQAKFSEDG
jgi:NADPH:quinone reductase-like Zn-dependent oxidoreductase